MTFSVKNELKTLVDSVRLVVSVLPENTVKSNIADRGTSSLNISFAGKVFIGSSFDLECEVRPGAFYMFKPTAVNIYRIVESFAVDLITQVSGLIRRAVRVFKREFAFLRKIRSRQIAGAKHAPVVSSGVLRL